MHSDPENVGKRKTCVPEGSVVYTYMYTPVVEEFACVCKTMRDYIL